MFSSTVLLFTVLVLPLSSCVTLYVSTTGNDNNPGTRGKPLLTVSKAYSMCSATTKNTIVVFSGFYGIDTNALELGSLSVHFVSQGGSSTFSCQGGSSNQSFVNLNVQNFGNEWYITSFNGIAFSGCAGLYGAIYVAVADTAGGGMAFDFNTVSFTAAPLSFDCWRACRVSFTNCDFVGTDEGSTGGVLVYARHTVITGCTFDGVSLSALTGTGVTITDSEFTNFKPADQDMEVMHFDTVETVILDNVKVDGCATPHWFLMSFNDVMFINVTNTQISSNMGMIIMQVWSSKLLINNSQITGNSGCSIVGLDSHTTAVFEDVSISGNTAVAGDLKLLDIVELDRRSSLVVSNAQITNNQGAQNGGAFYVARQSILNISLSTISGNQATEKGGAFYSNDGYLSFTEVTVQDNTAQTAGAGFCTDGYTFTETDSTFTDNTSKDGSTQLQCKHVHVG